MAKLSGKKVVELHSLTKDFRMMELDKLQAVILAGHLTKESIRQAQRIYKERSTEAALSNSVTLYGLRHIESGRLIDFSVSAQSDGEGNADYEVELSESYGSLDKLYTHNNLETIQKVNEYSAPWYNSCFDTPSHSMIGKLEVVKLSITVEKV